VTAVEFCLKYGTVFVVRPLRRRLPNPAQEVRIELRNRADLPRGWAVFYDGEMLSRQGEVAYDHVPSERTEQDYTLLRFSFEEAMAVSLALVEATPQGWLDDWDGVVRSAVKRAIGV